MVKSVLHAPFGQSSVQLLTPRRKIITAPFGTAFVFCLTTHAPFLSSHRGYPHRVRVPSGLFSGTFALQSVSTSKHVFQMVQGVNPYFMPSAFLNLKELPLFLRHLYFLPDKFLKSSVSECHRDKSTQGGPSLTFGASAAATDCEATREQKFHFTKNGLGLSMFGLTFISLNNRLELK